MLTVNGSRHRDRRNNRRRHQVGRLGRLILARVGRQRLSLGIPLRKLLMLDWLMLDWLNVPLLRRLSVLLRRLSVLLRRLSVLLRRLSVLLRRLKSLGVLLPGSRALLSILDGAKIAAQNWFLLAALRRAPLLCIKGKIQLDTGLIP